MMQSRPLAIVTMRRDLSARYASTTRQWLAARNAYRRLHEQPVKNIIALRDAAQRLDQLDRGRAALLRDLKALSDLSIFLSAIVHLSPRGPKAKQPCVHPYTD